MMYGLLESNIIFQQRGAGRGRLLAHERIACTSDSIQLAQLYLDTRSRYYRSDIHLSI
jgi:hypothetical protein